VRSDPCSDEGFATVLGLAIIVGLVALLMVASSAGAWLLAHSRAAAAADIAALVAASKGSCAAAQTAAHANGSRLEACSWRGGDVTVVVGTKVSRTPIFLPMEVHASARAGY
jgi:secretion/DNA translocation related TadE-like protein